MIFSQESTSIFSSWLLLIIGLTFYSEAFIYQESLNIDDLESLFGEYDCVDGSLSVTESGDPVIKSAAHVSTLHTPITFTKSKEKNETISDKSAMSLVYELAEFNQIKVQFTLTEEKGPAHKKQFLVSLQLGEEEYVGEGGSIKKAQHEASKLALNSTLYGHPPKRIKNNIILENKKTPVEQLNTWANKHNGATVVYSFYEQSKLMEKEPHKNYYHSDMYSKAKNIHKVKVNIANKAFTGEGSSLEIAKQNAASNALKSLQNIDGFCMLTNKEKSFFNKVFDSNSDDYSPISLVHEFGTISNMPVSFDLYSEEGPAHIKKFVFRCSVGDSFESFGEGSSKKTAKKEAAEEMVQELKRHSAFNSIKCGEIQKKSNSKKKKSRNLIKSNVKTYSVEEEEESTDAQYSIPEKLDPVSKLFQIQQAKHEVLPIFTSLEKANNQFVIEVSVNDLKAVGSGPNKKIAKKKAAEAILEQMGYSDNQKKDQSFSQEKKNEFSEVQGSSSKKNIAPGININSNKIHKLGNMEGSSFNERSKSGTKNENTHKLKDNLDNVNVPQQNSVGKENLKPQLQKKSGVRPKSQLLNLSQQLGFKFQFSDFPKVNDSGFVSIISLTTDPPKVCYGVGESSELAQDKAALSALSTLYKSQIDHISQILREDNTDSPVKTQFTTEEGSIVRTGVVRETD